MDLVKNDLVRPFLKWAGGKGQLLSILTGQLPETYYNYFEPFIGAGALLFSLQRSSAVIGDTNDELLNCYQVIKGQVDALLEALELHRARNSERYYYELRLEDRHPEFKSTCAVARAARLIFLNKTCYNGLFRVNSRGHFNVPYGRYRNPNIADARVLKAVSAYLSNNDIQITRGDFETTVKTASNSDFVYFDPPYDPVSITASFTGYDANGFSRNEQLRLKECVDELTARGCKVMLSNAYTEFIVELYKDYRQQKISATRAINSRADKRGTVNEILILNYDSH